MWLPRFVDKARPRFAGTLPALLREGSDEAIALWFSRRPDSREARVRDWNLLAPKIGMPGQPSNRIVAWGLRNLYAGRTRPRVNSGFNAIAWDEGFFDEVCPGVPDRPRDPAPARGEPATGR
jgi:hypothetical protein